MTPRELLGTAIVPGGGEELRLFRRGAMALAVAATVGLSGCAPTAQPDVEATLSAELTSAVGGVADTASTGDYSGALGRLDQLSASVDAAGVDGRISAERLTTLQSAIATVRADLDARRRAFTPRQQPAQPGVFGKYARLVSSASKGAVTVAVPDTQQQPAATRGQETETCAFTPTTT